jgi:hypothetical protein
MDLLRLQDILAYGVGQGFKEATRFAHPRSQRCAIKFDACTAIDCLRRPKIEPLVGIAPTEN